MEEEKNQLEALQDIRQMMKQSSRFLSLSGLSGVFAGCYALAGTWLAYLVIYGANGHPPLKQTEYANVVFKCILIGKGVLIFSLLTAVVFSNRKANKLGQKLLDHTARRLVLNMSIPLVAGGIFCFALMGDKSTIALVAPVMLMFYGMALVNGSKYTVRDIRSLGCMEIGLGLAASFCPELGLFFWALGFGVLHIFYGAYMWFKYDRT
jgi:hypothetical protein